MKKVILSLSLLLSYSLSHASDHEKPYTLATLLQIPNTSGDTLLHYAVNQWEDIRQLEEPTLKDRALERLQGKFKDTGTSNIEDYTHVIEKSTCRIIPHLKEIGFDLNIFNESGNTALCSAVKYKAITIVDALLKAGANPNHPNGNSVTPLQLACAQKNNGIIIRNLFAYGCSAESIFKTYKESDPSMLMINELLTVCPINAAVITTHLNNASSQEKISILLTAKNNIEAAKKQQEKALCEEYTHNSSKNSENKVQLKNRY